MLSFTNKNVIEKIIDLDKFSFFMHRLINNQDAMIVCITCFIVEELTKKVPKIINNFYREGVVQKLKELSN